MMRLWFLSFFAFLHLLPTASARPRRESPPPPEMKITLMRSGAIDCLPDCVEWIALEGKFDGHTPKQFREALALAKSAHPPILISSGGGDVDAAMAIGRIIRARGLDVIVTRAEALAPDPAAAPAADNRGISAKPQAVVDYGRPVLKGAFCASACTLVLASGVRRVVAPGVGVGVHEMLVPEQDQLQRVRYYQTRTLARGGRVVSKETRVVGERAFTRHIPRHDARADDYKRVLAYLGEMGLPAGEILKVMKTAAPEGMSWLSRPSLERTTLLATDSATPQVFLGLEKRAVAKTAAEPAPASASSERAVARNSVDQFARSVGVTPGWIMPLALAVLAMCAAIAISLGRGMRLSAPPPERRDPPLDL
ncbi:hypothetical protein [Methylocystis sp. S23]